MNVQDVKTIVHNERKDLMPEGMADPGNTVDRAITMMPEMFDKVTTMLKKDQKTKGGPAPAAPEAPAAPDAQETK